MEDSPSAAAATAVEVVTIQLTVTASQGAPRVPLTIDVSITPTALRQQAAAATNIPIGLLKIIFRGRLIADNVTQSAVTEYKLEEGSVLHCMGKPTATTTSTTTNDATTVSSSTTTTASSASGASIVLPTVSVVHPPNATAGLLASASDTAAETDPLQAALNLMRTSNPPSVYQTAVTTLDKILSNVIEDPMEEKYRSLKVQNPAFQRRLGGVPGGDAAIQACGFTIRRGTVEEEEEEDDRYVMAACAEKWPALLTAQAAVAQAVTWANAAAMPLRAVPAVPYAGGSGTATVPSWDGGAGLAGWMPSLGGDGGMADSPEIRQQVAQLLSNPQHLQAILQNPMVQNTMRSDPRFANNPMLRQAIEDMASNPEMAIQLSQLLSNPAVREQMQNTAAMEQMMQMMNGSMGGGGGGGGMPPLPSSNNMFSPNHRAAQPPPSNITTSGNSRANTSSGGGGANDAEQTEEEMIAEAIRRSLQDGGGS